MSAQRVRKRSIAGALAVGIAFYWFVMSWSFHRQHQAQIRAHTLLLKKIDVARERRQQLQALIEQRRAEILLRQKSVNRPGDFWTPRELDRLLRGNAPREG